MVSITRYPYVILALVATAQLWPWYVFDVGGDSIVYQLYIKCFAENLMSGVIRPSWCHAANSGYGTPVFFFYFPLPYYLASLFYPLKEWGLLSMREIFILQLCIANILFGATCYSWLRGHASKSVAIGLTVLLMYLPYRLELLYYRAAHAEILALVMFPLWLMAADRLISGRSSWHFLALIAGITALIHTHMALIFGLIVFFYTAFYTRRVATVGTIIIAGIVGVGFASYFLLPAAYYQQFIQGAGGGIDYETTTVNRYIMLHDFSSRRIILIFLTAISLLAVIILSSKALLNRHRLTLSPELKAWLWTFGAMALLYSPLIGLVFDHVELLRSIFFPWRVQVVFLPVTAMLALNYIELQQHAPNKQLRLGDALVLFAFLNLLQPFATQVMQENQERRVSSIVEDQLAPNSEYYSIWTDPQTPGSQFYQKTPPRVMVGDVEITEVDLVADQTSLQLVTKVGGSLWLKQAYFPSWKAYDEQGRALHIGPTKDRKGNTLVDVRKDTQHLVLYNRPYAHGPWYVQISPWISLGTLLFIAFSWRRRVSNA